MPEPELQTILNDVRIIKNILQNTDAPLPPIWRQIYFVAVPALSLVAVLKFFVPALAVLSFLDTLLWLWLPVMGCAALIVAVQVRRDLQKTGTRFLAQTRIRVFLYTRLILVPAVVTLGYLLSLNPAYSTEGAMAVLVAVGLTQVAMLTPPEFKILPVVFLFAGLAELVLNFRGPWWTLINTLAVAGTFLWFANLLQRSEKHSEATRG